MRKVIYFNGGTVADFAIPDDRFNDFTSQVNPKTLHSEDDLGLARAALANFMKGEENAEISAQEILAACFVWNFFNTHLEDHLHIDGDIMIVDLEGDGETIEYASVNDVQLTPGN